MLIEHPALAEIREDLRTSLLKLLAQAKGQPTKVEVSAAELRAHGIFSRVAELDNCLRSLRHAVAGLNSEATSASPNTDQYRYHTENYLLRLTGLYDRACRLAGIAIGMSPQEVDRGRRSDRSCGAPGSVIEHPLAQAVTIEHRGLHVRSASMGIPRADRRATGRRR
jgi:hypothetical protein